MQEKLYQFNMSPSPNKEKQEKSKWWQIIKVIIGLTIVGFLISMVLSLFTGSDFESLNGNVAVIDIPGTIVAQKDSGSFFEEVASSEDIVKLIQKASKNDKVKAIVLRINSPGGSAVASEEIASAIKKTNKTTVALIREVGASGAYWVASSTNHIIANRMSITGSIGVISSYLGFSGFLQEHNVTYERLVSGNLKDIGSPFKDLTGEEKALLEKKLGAIHDYFVDEVAKNRNLKKKDVEKAATGLFYLGSEAKDLGLVDELGGNDEVIKYLEDKLGEKVEFAEYETEKGFLSSLSKVMNKNSFYIGEGIGSAFFTKAKLADSISIST